VLGFFGDETDLQRLHPLDPQSCSKSSRNRRGYDLKPYIPMWFMASSPTKPARQSDYYDVWSAMFATNLFDVLADWNQKTTWKTSGISAPAVCRSHDSQRG